MKRKFMSIFLVVLMILSLSTTALAVDATSMRLSGVYSGSTVVLRAYLTAAGATNGRVQITYDPEVLTLIRVAPGSDSWITSVNKETEGEVYFAWVASDFPAEESLLVTLTLSERSSGMSEDSFGMAVEELYDSGIALPLPEEADCSLRELPDPVGPAIPVPGQPTLPDTTDPVDPTDGPFDDIQDHWAEEDILTAYYAGLVNGTGNGKFSPDQALTRGMFATLLYRLAGTPEVIGEHPFEDVIDGKYYDKAVLWAYQNEVVNGTSATTFAPDDTLTRQQMVAMLYRYAKWAEIDVSASAQLDGFSDSASVSGYAVDAMKWAVAENIIKGVDGALKPADTTNRAQAATVLVRFVD